MLIRNGNVDGAVGTIFEKGRADDKCVDFKSNIIQTNLEDCYIIEENRFGDDRGYFSPYFIQKNLILLHLIS